MRGNWGCMGRLGRPWEVQSGRSGWRKMCSTSAIRCQGGVIQRRSGVTLWTFTEVSKQDRETTK